MTKMEKLSAADAQSLDIVDDNIRQLKEIFPEVFAEDKIDFARLQELLSHDIIGDEDHYSFTWHGKRAAAQLAQTPSTGTLRPCVGESVDWDTTQNLFIEGDNLEVLKLLQKSYHRQIKMIYIDPPYNTGNDFVYKDDFKDNIKNYLEITGQLDSEGKTKGTNSSSAGRYHTNWLNMMYPRLKLARNLLRDDGVIMISIDENELPNLWKVCDDIFGEENFVECLVYDKKAAPKGVPPVNMIVGVHEYILCYQKTSQFSFVGVPRSIEGFSNPDNDPKGLWRNTNCKSTVKDSSGAYAIKDPKTGIEYTDTWAFSKVEMERLAQEGILLFPKKPDGQVRMKEYYNEFKNQNIPVKSSLGLYDAQSNTEAITDLMGGKFFQNPKHIDLMTAIVSFTTKEDDIALDFFAGSATTAHALMSVNAQGLGTRRFILVQMPEVSDENSDGFKAGYKNIADISKERIRRAGKKIKEDNPLFTGDTGFKVFKLDTSNIKLWDGGFETLEKDLLDAVDYIKQDRTNDDVLYELLLKYGLDLTVPIETRTIAGKTVYSIGLGALVVCLEKDIAMDVVTGIGALKEELKSEIMRVVFRDSGFKDDTVKTNALQTLKQFGVEDIKSL